MHTIQYFVGKVIKYFVAQDWRGGTNLIIFFKDNSQFTAKKAKKISLVLKGENPRIITSSDGFEPARSKIVEGVNLMTEGEYTNVVFYLSDEVKLILDGMEGEGEITPSPLRLVDTKKPRLSLVR